MSQTTTERTERPLAQRLTGTHTQEGAGFPVRRPFPGHGLQMVDPFLLLDEMGPKDWAPGQAQGAPDHPHRGFETVTYMLDGRFEHRDSFGFSGQLNPGDVQWMTAGAGVVHSEMPEETLRRDGGRVHGIQLWVNLPATDKWVQPRYQDTPAERIPEVTGDWGRARVIAGEALGASAVIETRIPILYLHLTIEPGHEVTVEVPAAYQGFVYPLAGSGTVSVGDNALADGELGLLGEGEPVRLGAPAGTDQPADLLLVAGRPLGEPVARYGPFVMTNREEIDQAFQDFRDGRMGEIPRPG
ncbi:pirin family protein [Thiohalorhabdus sp.]|uniref:pirin family protein n=1 Tax=Thiohalorhabdus sp. TaxID=3094134 RepID=UPI002FC28E90